jgi:hypothetical protein
MRPLLYILPFFAVMGLAFWAYHENYATQGQLKQMARLQDEIGRLRDEIAMQKAEWAYLNRPSRMRDLAALNFDRLGLMPIEPNQLGLATQVVMPAAGPLVVTGTTIAVSAGALSADPEQEQIP